MQRLTTEMNTLIEGFDRSEEHVVITNVEGRIVYVNAGAEKHTGYSREEMLGKTPGDLWGGHMDASFYRAMWETIRHHKQAYIGEMRNKKKNGEMYWQEVHIIPILDADGEILYFIGIELSIDDVNRREQLMQGFRSEQGMKVQWPLAWLFEKSALSEDQLKELQRYYSNAKALDLLTQDLLTLSNILYANKERDEDVCLVSLIKDIMQDIQGSYPNRRYRFEHTDPSCVILENKRLLHEALQRIIVNAAQYCAPNAGDVVLILLRSGSQCVVRCEDNGIGIMFHEQRKIFEKFYRGAQSRNLHPDGSGLGLYIVKTIADIRGWSVSFVSEEKKGSCFTLNIPVKNMAHAA